MPSLANKNILLGISGGIAAYKSADLVRRLRDAGADVRVVMTRSACEFVTPLTFQAVSGHPVHTELLDPAAEAAMSHIELARWADVVLIAPATANTISRLAQGTANDLLSTLWLATRALRAVAPAMNHVMWSDTPTQHNVQLLQQRGVHIFGPASGAQACGETGEGRMLEPIELVTRTANLFASGALEGCKVMITAGPTHEAIDPVRFIGNRSSGKMGFELARAAAEAGADVTLIAGPVHLATPEHVRRMDVESAMQMHQAVMNSIVGQNIFIGCAAVADYRVAQVATDKIKKSANTLHLELVKNPDILAEVAALKHPPFCVGFAAETRDVENHARAKLAAKKLAMIAANDVSGRDSGFNSEYNALHVFWPGGEQKLERATKSQLARQLIELIAHHYKKTT